MINKFCSFCRYCRYFFSTSGKIRKPTNVFFVGNVSIYIKFHKRYIEGHICVHPQKEIFCHIYFQIDRQKEHCEHYFKINNLAKWKTDNTKHKTDNTNRRLTVYFLSVNNAWHYYQERKQQSTLYLYCRFCVLYCRFFNFLSHWF